MASTDNKYLSLLSLAEHFRVSNPPNIKLCIHCLQAIFNLKPPPRAEARTHMQLGAVLLQHTKNLDLAEKNLQDAWRISQTIPSFDEVKFESASLLSEVCNKQGRAQDAKPILRKAIELSQASPFWHCRLLFQLAQIHATERDYTSANGLLGIGADYCGMKNSEHTKILFLLARGMLLLIEKKLQEVHAVLSQSGNLIEHMNNPQLSSQKESLKVFFLVLQVCHYLMAGQVKSVKPALKQLQHSIQTITSIHSDDEPHVYSSNPADQFQWLPKEHMCVLVYLVTVMHSMQAGYMDKAQKYTEKALMQIEKLKITQFGSSRMATIVVLGSGQHRKEVLDSHPLLSSFQLMLLEHIIMCRLIMGNKSTAIQEIFQACSVCEHQPKLFEAHGSQLHTLLGLYAMSMNCMEAADAQFKTAIAQSSEDDLKTFIKLNQAIVYLRTNRQSDLSTLIESIDPDKISAERSHSLKASAFYVKGLQSFFQAKYSDAKKYLRETLKMANAEDLNRLTSCSLVLLGHIFLNLGNSQEALNMVTPAMQLAGKIPDVHVQLWASALLKDLYRLCGNPQGEAEGYRLHDTFTQQLLKDHFQSSQSSLHKLIQWTDGACPFHLANSTEEEIPHSSAGLL